MMIKEKVLSCPSALSVSWLLIACVPGLSDDASLCFGRSSGSIPPSRRQTTKVHIRDTPPRYLSAVEEVVVEFGGTPGVSDEDRVDGYVTKGTTDMGIHWMTTVIPATDHEDLRWVVVEGTQRNSFRCLRDPVRRDKLNSRTVTVGDEYGNKLGFYHHEAKDGTVIDLYSGCMFSSQPLDLDTPRWSYPLPSPEEIFPNLTIV